MKDDVAVACERTFRKKENLHVLTTTKGCILSLPAGSVLEKVVETEKKMRQKKKKPSNNNNNNKYK